MPHPPSTHVSPFQSAVSHPPSPHVSPSHPSVPNPQPTHLTLHALPQLAAPLRDSKMVVTHHAPVTLPPLPQYCLILYPNCPHPITSPHYLITFHGPLSHCRFKIESHRCIYVQPGHCSCFVFTMIMLCWLFSLLDQGVLMNGFFDLLGALQTLLMKNKIPISIIVYLSTVNLTK